MTHAEKYLEQTARLAAAVDAGSVERLALALADLRARGGRLFLLGVGGSAANCSHAVNDFRKLAGIDAIAPTDNVAELTARTNDEGWETVFAACLQVSRATGNDAVLVLSVGGGDSRRNVSPNIVRALEEARARGLRIFGIVGRDGGYTASVADTVVRIPVIDPDLLTPHTEGFQSVICHCLVSHPALCAAPPRWESLDGAAR
jgi:D-sedoheptulose 7-phosphate isomerase